MVQMKRILSMAVVVILAIGVFAIPVHAADKPAWTQGDKWAMGMESEPPSQEQISEMEDAMKTIFNLSDLSMDLDGSGGMWITFEVTDVSDTEYTLHYSMALKNSVTEDYSVKAMMPEPGTYTPENFRNAERSMRSMEAHISTDLYVLGSGDTIVEKENMGVKSTTLNLEEKYVVDFSGKNLPSVGEYGIFGYFMLTTGIDEDTGNGYGTPPMYPPLSSYDLKYEDMRMKLTQNLNLDLNISYNPPAVFIEFPLNDGNEWNVSSDVNITGTYSGTIDASGLPSMVKSMVTAGTGQDFPIKIEKINTQSPDFNNGTINSDNEMDMALECDGTMQINDENGNAITVYRIHHAPTYDFSAPSPLYLLYSPDKGFIAGMYWELPKNGMMPVMPGMQNSTMPQSFGALLGSMDNLQEQSTLTYMDYAEASSKISTTEQEMKGTGNQDFFSSPVFFILMGVVGAAAVIVAMIAVRKRKRPMSMAGPAEETSMDEEVRSGQMNNPPGEPAVESPEDEELPKF